MSEDSIFDPGPPKGYASVSVLMPDVRAITYEGGRVKGDDGVIREGDRVDGQRMEVVYIPIRHADDTIPHLEQIRSRKGCAVIGLHNFQLHARTVTGEEKRDARRLRLTIEQMINPPEVKLSKAVKELRAAKTDKPAVKKDEKDASA